MPVWEIFTDIVRYHLIHESSNFASLLKEAMALS